MSPDVFQNDKTSIQNAKTCVPNVKTASCRPQTMRVLNQSTVAGRKDLTLRISKTIYDTKFRSSKAHEASEETESWHKMRGKQSLDAHLGGNDEWERHAAHPGAAPHRKTFVRSLRSRFVQPCVSRMRALKKGLVTCILRPEIVGDLPFLSVKYYLEDIIVGAIEYMSLAPELMLGGCMYVCMYGYIYIYIYIYIHTHTHTYIYGGCIYVYVCVCVCLYMYMFKFKFKFLLNDPVT